VLKWRCFGAEVAVGVWRVGTWQHRVPPLPASATSHGEARHKTSKSEEKIVALCYCEVFNPHILVLKPIITNANSPSSSFGSGLGKSGSGSDNAALMLTDIFKLSLQMKDPVKKTTFQSIFYFIFNYLLSPSTAGKIAAVYIQF
jgi:hypothetical protein